MNPVWEYKVLVLPASNYDVDEEILNLHGEKSWELVGVIMDQASYRVCYFKRASRPGANIPSVDTSQGTHA